MKLKKLTSLVIMLTLLITSCGNPPSSNQNGSNQGKNIEIQITGTESKELGTETISQPNCTGVAEVENSVEKSRTIEYVMEVQNGASVNANGKVGFAGTEVELGTTVAGQFGQSYGTSETLTRSITVKAKPGTNMQHVIRQVEIWKVGQAKISVGGQQTIITFKFRSGFAIELANSQDLGCGTPTIVPVNPTNPPISGPISTKVSLPANAGWVETNVYVQAGQLLKITAEGKASTLAGDPNSDATPNGFQWQGVNCDKDYVEKVVGEKFTIDCLMTGAPWGALVGRISTGTPFLVGNFVQLKPTDSGNLFLAFNDCCTLSDNTGEYLVTIQLP